MTARGRGGRGPSASGRPPSAQPAMKRPPSRRPLSRRLSGSRLSGSRPSGSRPPRKRLVAIRTLATFGFVLLGARLVMVQVLSANRYAAFGAAEVTSDVVVPALRGGIYDRSGRALAMSVPVKDVVADPFIIHHPAEEATALSGVLGASEPSLLAELTEHSGYVVLARGLGQHESSKLAALDLPGINLIPASEWVDPAGSIAAPVIGQVGTDGNGLSGLEYQYNSLLAGHPGREEVESSPGGVPLPGGTKVLAPARPGSSLELTIDQPLQYVTDQALGHELLASHANSGTAVVMNTKTGGILAMANLVVDEKTHQVLEAPSNLAVTQVYEPGSVFKIVTFSAALEDGLITPDTMFTIPPYLMLGGWEFHDAWSHGTIQLPAIQVIAQSSNIGTIEIAERLGKYRLAKQITALGFGEPTGLHFPGASPGIVNPVSKWSISAMGSTPIGQDAGVTALQVADAMNTVANGGVFIPPHLVRAIVSPSGKLSVPRREPSRRVFSSDTAKVLTRMLEQVVIDGTGVKAPIPGYSVAGKTGTANIPNGHGGYEANGYMATFTGFAPAEHPALTAVVTIDHGWPPYGGSIAAPVFSEVMRYALHHYGVPTSPGGGITGGKPRLVPYGLGIQGPGVEAGPAVPQVAQAPSTPEMVASRQSAPASEAVSRHVSPGGARAGSSIASSAGYLPEKKRR